MISDTNKILKIWCYYRSKDIAMRKRYVKLVDGVKENGGVVRIFSSLHVSGERESYIFTIPLLKLNLETNTNILVSKT